ncbi:MAG: TetR-like C-terminal domain-containing protein [Oscillospiraceae bacterium]|nr:TetR-like C-terminal domain-containing protein [Oscillospiraceae bacterium]
MANLSQEAIRNSFIRLISEKPFDKITVKEVIDDCQIARRTFYYHYQDLYAVVEDILRLETEKAIRDYQAGGTLEECFIAAGKFILQNKRAIYHLFYSEHRLELIRYVDRTASDVMDRYLNEMVGGRTVREEDLRLIASFYKSALSGIVFEWLEGGTKTDPAAAVRRLGVLFGDNIERALQISAEQA